MGLQRPAGRWIVGDAMLRMLTMGGDDGAWPDGVGRWALLRGGGQAGGDWRRAGVGGGRWAGDQGD